MLPDAGALAVEQSHQDPRGCERPRVEVARADTGRVRPAVAVADPAHHAAHRFGDDGQRRPVDEWARVDVAGAEPGDGRVDQPFIERSQPAVAQAEPVEGVGPEVVDEHIGPHGQRLERVAAGRRLQVEDDALLVTAEAELVGAGHRAIRGDEGRPLRSVDLARRRLHLDHACAGVGEQHRAVGAGREVREVDDHDPFQRPRDAHLLSSSPSKGSIAFPCPRRECLSMVTAAAPTRP